MGKTLGRSGDGGIDGVIKEDELGLDVVYVQAKRFAQERCVPIREVRDFVGGNRLRISQQMRPVVHLGELVELDGG